MTLLYVNPSMESPDWHLQADWLVNWLVDCMASQPNVRLSDWLAGWLSDRLTDWWSYSDWMID